MFQNTIRLDAYHRVRIWKKVISDLKRENQFLSKEIWEFTLNDKPLDKELQTGFKTGFYEHGITDTDEKRKRNFPHI